MISARSCRKNGSRMRSRWRWTGRRSPGSCRTPSLQFQLSPEEQLFLQRTTLAIGLAALAGVLVAVAMGFLLAGGLLKPIRRLTQASQALARGDLEQQVPVTSQDELGQLTATFNQMSADLAEADQQRKRMTADITHDLSTPLQIISGYMEMLEEGEVTPDPAAHRDHQDRNRAPAPPGGRLDHPHPGGSRRAGHPAAAGAARRAAGTHLTRPTSRSPPARGWNWCWMRLKASRRFWWMKGACCRC